MIILHYAMNHSYLQSFKIMKINLFYFRVFIVVFCIYQLISDQIRMHKLYGRITRTEIEIVLVFDIWLELFISVRVMPLA